MIFYIVVSAICDYGFNFITIISGAVIWSIGSYAVKFIFSIDEKIIRQLNKKSFRLINNLQNNYNNITIEFPQNK